MTYDRPQEWQPPRGSLIDEDQGWEPPEGSLLPVEEEERQPSLWERIAATNQVMSPVEQLSAAYRGLQQQFPGLFMLSDEEAGRQDQSDLEYQEGRVTRAEERLAEREAETFRDLVARNPRYVDAAHPDQLMADRRASAARELEDARQDLQRAQEVAAGEREGVTMRRWASWSHGLINSATRLPGDAMRVGSNVEAAVRGMVSGEEVTQDETWIWDQADQFEERQQNTFPTDAHRVEQGEFGQSLAEGAGSTLPYLATGFAGAARMPIMMAMGSTQGGSESVQDAVAHDATFSQGLIGTLIGMGIGASEAIPLSRAMSRIERLRPGQFNWGEILRQGGMEAVEEAIQEGGAQIAQNANALIVGWDRNRDVMQGAGKAALLGGVLGFGIGGGMGVLGQVQNAGRPKLEDDTLVGSIVQLEAEYRAAWDAMRANGASTVDVINDEGIQHQANSLEILRNEAEARGLEIPAPAMEDQVIPEARNEIQRLSEIVSVGLASNENLSEPQRAASVAVFEAKLEALAAKDPEAFERRARELNLRVQAAEPGEEANELNQFAGIGAKTADQTSLVAAMSMQGKGVDPAEILQVTGWFQGLDDKWRFELSDREAAWITDDPETTSLSGRLGDILQHDKMFEAYPLLRSINLDVQIDPSLTESQIEGAYGAELGKAAVIEVKARSLDEALTTTLHEAQHAIQHIEKFAPGGNPAMAKAYYAERAGPAGELLQRQYAEGSPNHEVLMEAIHTMDHPGMHAVLAEFPTALLMTDQTKAFEAIAERAMVQEIADSFARGEGMGDAEYEATEANLWKEYKAFLGSPEVKAIRDHVREHYRENGIELFEHPGRKALVPPGSFHFYSALAGEIEARLTERRQKMTNAQRRQITPWQSDRNMAGEEQRALSDPIVLPPHAMDSPHRNMRTFNQSAPKVAGSPRVSGNRHGFMPHLLQRASKKPRDGARPSFAQVTNNKNASAQIASIDGILDAHPDAHTSPAAWANMMSEALAADVVPVAPFKFIEDINGEGAVDLLSGLTRGQIADADHGFKNAADFREAYINGQISIEDTGRLFLWSFLSRGVSPYTQESLFIDSFDGIGEWIQAAADGTLKSRMGEYEAWARSAAPKGSGLPGAGATHNLNAFGKNFLARMSEPAGDGTDRSRLQMIHDMMSDPNTTGAEIRREFMRVGEGVGIDNKVVSFTLLVAGFSDVMVLDRVQMRQLWNDGRFDGLNLYDGYKDGGKPVTGSALSNLTYGARGLLVYEAIERAIQKNIDRIYAGLGRPEAASVGRYHWETWVASSQQEASHATIDAILAEAKGEANPLQGVTAKEGEYGAYAYGARYGRGIDGDPFFVYEVPNAGVYRFTPEQFSAFLAEVKKPSNGVVPPKFKVTESGNAPWYTRSEVNQTRLAEIAGEVGQGLSAEQVRELDEQHGPEPEAANRSAANQPGGPGQALELNQAGITSTPEFREWFGDSQVVDAGGDPLVVYHRTSEDFTGFQGDTIYFGDDPSNLQQLHNRKAEGDRIIPAYLSISTPLELDEFNLKEMQDRWADGSKEFPFDITPETRARLEEAGFDGIISDNVYGDNGREMIAFAPGQIKSPHNQGTFDRGNPDILMQSPTETAAFKQWFGDSQVVDEGGDPLVVYHGTDQRFDAFHGVSHFGTSQAANDRLTDKRHPNGGKVQDGEQILPVYLSISSPLDVGAERSGTANYWNDEEDMIFQVARILERREGNIEAAKELRALVQSEQELMSRGGFSDEGRRAFAEILEGLGYDGIVYQNTLEDKGSNSWIPLRPEQVKSPHNQGTFDPADPDIMGQENRASITIPEGGVFSGEEVLIRLGEASDASSFMHESAHLFLELYRELAEDSQVIRAEYDQIREWLGVAEGEQITRDQHEKFAEGFEAYLKEGRAPVSGLQAAFEAFAKWLSKIYRSMRMDNRLNLDPEGRRVMDRLFLVPQSERTLGRRKRKTYTPPVGGRSRGVAIPAGEGQDVDAIAIRDLVKDLTRALGVAVNEGRLEVRGADGEFHERTSEIRLRLGEDFTTLVHEAGHLLAARYPDAYRAVEAEARQEIMKLNAGVHAPVGQEFDEAFAEMVRIFVEGPAYLANETPNALSAFVREFTKADPLMMEALQDLAIRYNSYMTQSSERAISGHISKTGVRDGISGVIDNVRRARERFGHNTPTIVADFLTGFYAGMFDKTAPIYRVQADLASMYQQNHGKNYSFTPSKDFSRLARLSADGHQAGLVDIMSGVVPYKQLQASGASLGEALEMALGKKFLQWNEQSMQDFGSYLVSRRMVEEYRRYNDGELRQAPDLFTLEEHLQNIRDKEAANPGYRRAADMINEWNQNLLRKKLDAGFITQDQFDRFTNARNFYVPVLRDRDATRDRPSGIDSMARSDKQNKDNRIRPFRGSQRAIINPIESMIRDAYQTNMAIWRNETIGALLKMAEAVGPGSSEILTEVPKSVTVARQVDAASAFRVAAQRAGVDEQDAAMVVGSMEEVLDGQTMAVIYGAKEAPEMGDQILYYWDKGERRSLKLHDDPRGRMLWDALVGLGKDRHHWLVELVSLPTRLLTQTITGHPVFPLINWLRDQMSTAALSGNGYMPGVSGLQGADALLRDQKTVDEYMVAGGHMGGINASIADRNRRTTNINDLRRNRGVRELVSWRGVSAAFDVTESATRLGNYKAYTKMMKKLGLSDWDAALHAAYQSRDIMDYRRKGGSMTAYLMTRLIPFFNPALQGTEKAVRTALGGRSTRELPRILRSLMSGRPSNMSEAEKQDRRAAMTLWPWLAATSVFSAMLATIHADDDDYWQIDDRMRATHWHLWKTPDGDWVRFPKFFELAVPANIMERYILMRHANDETQGEKMFTDLQHTVVPPYEIPGYQVLAETTTNTTLEGRDIVPRHMRDLPAPMQYDERTTAFSRWMGETFGVSPMIMDHLLFSLGGTYAADYRIAERAADPNAPDLRSDQILFWRRFLDRPESGSQHAADFWDTVGRRGQGLEGGLAAFRAFTNDPRQHADGITYFRNLDTVTQNYIIARMFAGDGPVHPLASRLHPIQRAEGVMRANSALRRALQDNEMTRPRSTEVIELPGDVRRQAIDTLSALSVWEADNALREVGYEHRLERPQADYEALIEGLEGISPEVYQVYRQTLAQNVGMQAVDPITSARQWGMIEDRLGEVAQNSELLHMLMQRHHQETVRRGR